MGQGDHFDDLDGARPVRTRQLIRAEQNVGDVIGAHGMTVISGEPGMGKSFAAARIAATVKGRHAKVCEAVVQANPRALGNEILARLTGVAHHETRFAATHTLVELLRREPAVLFIDEAQRLSLVCLEWVRYLHEQVPERLPLVLVGGPTAFQRLKRDPQLMRRVMAPTFFTRIPPEELQEVLCSFHDFWSTVSREDIAWADKWLKGNFGHWAKVTGAVQQLRRRPGAAGLSPHDLLGMALSRERAI